MRLELRAMSELKISIGESLAYRWYLEPGDQMRSLGSE